MKYILEKKRMAMIIFVIMICIASFYYVYIKFNAKRPMSAKLVFMVQKYLECEFDEYQ